MSGLRYYYPSNDDEAGAPPGIEVECDGFRVTLVVDTDSRYPAQLVELTGDEAMRLAGALNRAALCALPEPPPVDADGDVLADVILDERLRMHRSRGEAAEVSAQLVEFLHQRREFGLAKYGKTLARENGRDHMRDALDELLDAMAYSFAGKNWDMYESARGAAIVAIRKMKKVER